MQRQSLSTPRRISKMTYLKLDFKIRWCISRKNKIVNVHRNEKPAVKSMILDVSQKVPFKLYGCIKSWCGTILQVNVMASLNYFRIFLLKMKRKGVICFFGALEALIGRTICNYIASSEITFNNNVR